MGGLPVDSVRAMVRWLDGVFVKVHSTGTPFDAKRQVIRSVELALLSTPGIGTRCPP